MSCGEASNEESGTDAPRRYSTQSAIGVSGRVDFLLRDGEVHTLDLRHPVNALSWVSRSGKAVEMADQRGNQETCNGFDGFRAFGGFRTSLTG